MKAHVRPDSEAGNSAVSWNSPSGNSLWIGNSPAEVAEYFLSETHPGCVVEFLEGPDHIGRYTFFYYWLAHYHPGRAEGECGPGIRGQIFFTSEIPEHAFEVDRRGPVVKKLKKGIDGWHAVL